MYKDDSTVRAVTSDAFVVIETIKAVGLGRMPQKPARDLSKSEDLSIRPHHHTNGQ